MEVAGIHVADRLVLELALRLRQANYTDTADRLDDAVVDYEDRVTLTIADRDAIIAVLEEADAELAELRAVLIQEHVARKQTGL